MTWKIVTPVPVTGADSLIGDIIDWARSVILIEKASTSEGVAGRSIAAFSDSVPRTAASIHLAGLLFREPSARMRLQMRRS